MNRIYTLLKKKKCFVGYLTAGDGGIDYSHDMALAMLAGGVDILEIGMPFSDPVADGPTIQKAMTRALACGTTLASVLCMIKRLREQTNAPIVLFGYANPVYVKSPDIYADIKAAGVDALLLVDLPFEEAATHRELCAEAGLGVIDLLAPVSTAARVEKLAAKNDTCLYYAAQKGTTGMRDALPSGFAEKIAEIRSVTDIPLIAGFGISNREMAAAFLKEVDGFVVGSYFVRAMAAKVTRAQMIALTAALDPRGEK